MKLNVNKISHILKFYVHTNMDVRRTNFKEGQDCTQMLEDLTAMIFPIIYNIAKKVKTAHLNIIQFNYSYILVRFYLTCQLK